MVYRFVELSDIYLQTVFRACAVFVERVTHVDCAFVNAAFLDTAVGRFDERCDPYRLKHIHDCMMHYSVGEIRQTTDMTLFRLVYHERVIS